VCVCAWRFVLSPLCVQTEKIKLAVEEKEGIPPAQQRLIFLGKAMYVPCLPAVRAALERVLRLIGILPTWIWTGPTIRARST
jgi:hypothetical protein